MVTLITTEIELSQDEIKEAIKYWLRNHHEITHEDMITSFWDNNAEYTNLTAKITFTKK